MNFTPQQKLTNSSDKSKYKSFPMIRIIEATVDIFNLQPTFTYDILPAASISHGKFVPNGLKSFFNIFYLLLTMLTLVTYTV